MLEWLKAILGEAYSEETDKKVSEEIGKDFVARADFNTLSAEKKTLADTVKERDRQLETLKATTGDVEALKTKIATLQTENAAAAKAYEAEIKSLKIDTAVELALSAAKAKNVKAVKALLDLDKAELDADGTVKGLAEIKSLKIDTAVELALSAAKAKNVKAVKALLDLDKAELDADGTVKGLADQIKKLTEAPDSNFLFETGRAGFKGFKPGESSGPNNQPPDYSKMTYDELAAYMENNPDAAN